MKIDLFDFVGVNENTKILEEEIAFRKELHKLIAAIISDEESFYTDNDELVERLKLKTKNVSNIISKATGGNWTYKTFRYKVELNKSNIKKVQKYLDNEVYDDEDAY